MGEDAEEALKEKLISVSFQHISNEVSMRKLSKAMQYHEQQFKHVRDATGIGNIDELLDKFERQAPKMDLI